MSKELNTEQRKVGEFLLLSLGNQVDLHVHVTKAPLMTKVLWFVQRDVGERICG